MTVLQANGHVTGYANGTNPKMDHLDIEVDHGKIPTHNLKWLPSFPIDTPDEVLRKEFAEKGVVHIKNAMPRELVQGVRARFFEQVSPSGILAENSKPVDGTWCAERPKDFVWPRTDKAALEGEREYAKLAADWHIGDESAAFCENPPLMKLVSRMRPDWTSPFCLRRQIFRTWLPGDGGRTGIHYDQIFLRHGPAEDTMTAWIPVGDVAPHEGGLIYLEDSVRTGMEAERAWTAMSQQNSFDDALSKRCDNPNMTQGTIPPDVKQSLVSEHGTDRKWLVGNYEAGDVVFHHMYMIHASGANMNKENRIRFSADLRFTDRDGKYDPRWDNPFVPGDGL